tara:strand:- start:138 stop:266 length:129 start_codon:yes stop_codon:yes gene_type:complete
VIGEGYAKPDARGEVAYAVPHDVNRDEPISVRGEVDMSDRVA